MKAIPVVHSIVSASHLGLILQGSYGFSADLRCRIMRTGINHTYLISDGEKKYVFRLYSYNWRTAQEIEEEIRLLNHLRESGVRVSYSLMDQHRQYIQNLPAPEGLRYGVLFSYAPGKKVRFLSTDLCYSIGEQMARMHRSAEKMRLGRAVYDLPAFTSGPFALAERHFSPNNADLQFLKKAGSLLSNLFSGANKKEIREGIIHLDIWYDNLQVSSDGNITLIDFDFCGNGLLLHDIAYFLMQLFHVETNKAEYEMKREAFMSGYESVAHISAAEQQLLPYSGICSWLFYLGIQSLRFDDWSNVFLSNNYLNRYAGMLKGWLEYYKVEIPHD